jgi:glycosyltransferase involved in cell wall biosynthesis
MRLPCPNRRRGGRNFTTDFENYNIGAERSGLPVDVRSSRGLRLARIDEPLKRDRCVGTDRRPVVWFEVEDFLRYFDHFRTPTGSQRVPFEIFVEAQRLYARQGRVRFCRLSVYTKQLMPIDFDSIISAYLKPPGANAPWKTVWAPARLLDEFSKMGPVIIRNPRFFLRIAKTAVRDFVDMTVQPRRFAEVARPGDILISLGASWGLPDYAKHIAAAKARYGLRFAFLIYDMIPIENASLVERRHALQFRKWLQETASNADAILTISQYSRQVLLDFAAAAGWTLPRVDVVRLGGGVSPRPTADGRSKICLPGRNVLFVSTIEIRKNHRLLVRVWRRLIARHGTEAVPALIFAGQIGWMVDDLLADLAASGHLGGKIEHRPGLSDEELDEAYRSCLFTGLSEPLRVLGIADCRKPCACQVLRCFQSHIYPGGGRQLDRLFRPVGRRRRAGEDREIAVRARLFGSEGGAIAGRISPPHMGGLCAFTRARAQSVGAAIHSISARDSALRPRSQLETP